MKSRNTNDRAGFTLVELLVVISIILLLAILAGAVFTGRMSDRMRSAARISQSAFLGAKDRALHAKDLRGIRLTRDQTDPTLANGFVYLQPLPMQTYPGGSFKLDRLDQNPNDNVPDSPDIYIVRGNNPQPPPATALSVDWYDISKFFPPNPKIRIPSNSGQWYTFTMSNPKYPFGPTNQVLQLLTPFAQQPTDPLYMYPNSNTAFPASVTTFTSCDIQLGNELLPFHQPISLPSGIVIDLKYCSTNVQTLAGIGTGSLPLVDIMFSPRGGVTGYLTALGQIHFFLRDLKDAADSTSNPLAVGPPGSANADVTKGERMILTVFPQSGLVQVFEFDPGDLVDNNTGAAVPDGLADNPFNFAQQVKTAGR